MAARTTGVGAASTATATSSRAARATNETSARESSGPTSTRMGQSAS